MEKYILILFLSLATLTANAQTSSEKLIREGVALHDKGRYKDAIDLYKQALEVNPSSMSAVYEMSLSYLHLKDYENAIRFSSRVISANFPLLLMDAYIVKSTAYANQGKYNDAIKLLNEALDRCGDEYLLHFNLGLSYFNKKENRMAVRHLRQAIQIDATHSSAFLLYAYALNDMGRWVQSFYSFHFFLLLEPNTARSKDAFAEMMDILNASLEEAPDKLTQEEGIDRKRIYDLIKTKRPKATDDKIQYKFFEEVSKSIFFTFGQFQDNTQGSLFWLFFVPTFDEILGSGHFETYCRYVSVSYFPESLSWWEKNKTQVDNFIDWFENGQNGSEEDAYFGDETDNVK
ncbi:tetratricopeptide repeat protein [Dysgonomonas sp. 511]|uniref:tetratricopeptide repeat protein n=1 Tax=Dysgonomonas sp. 511 TaxID=2302930 RepID=UPI0013D2BD67|nr:tetratricopeptide repeat protein [Dysgonomonas sp. 511]NDV79130.1 tetratricopeptide repeat protein [Dysgonomonas sp. 511]